MTDLPHWDDTGITHIEVDGEQPLRTTQATIETYTGSAPRGNGQHTAASWPSQNDNELDPGTDAVDVMNVLFLFTQEVNTVCLDHGRKSSTDEAHSSCDA